MRHRKLRRTTDICYNVVVKWSRTNLRIYYMAAFRYCLSYFRSVKSRLISELKLVVFLSVNKRPSTCRCRWRLLLSPILYNKRVRLRLFLRNTPDLMWFLKTFFSKFRVIRLRKIIARPKKHARFLKCSNFLIDPAEFWSIHFFLFRFRPVLECPLQGSFHSHRAGRNGPKKIPASYCTYTLCAQLHATTRLLVDR